MTKYSLLNPRPLPPTEVLLQRLQLAPHVPGGLLWRDCRNRLRNGTRAGCDGGAGYHRVRIDTTRYKSHRVVWAMHSGKDPGLLQIDHIDGNPSNNDPANLRLATPGQNTRNVGGNKNTSSRHAGVCRYRRKNGSLCWYAYIDFDKQRYSLGYFADQDDAARAYNAKAAELHGEFARLNVI